MLQLPLWVRLLAMVAYLAFLAGLVYVILMAVRGFRSGVVSRIQPIMARLQEISGPPSADAVDLYVVTGVLVWAEEQSQRVYLTRANLDEVEILARQLRAISFKWGMFAHGALFIPFMIWWNYRKVFLKIGQCRRLL
jgi:hypothetical protein